MKSSYDLVLHCAKTYKSNTYKVARKISSLMKLDISHIDKVDFSTYESIIFCCPTFGDEELPSNMEFFLEKLQVRDKNYTVCELGNYFGIENKEFGVSKIIRFKLNTLGWKLKSCCLSLDSAPKIDWKSLKNWIVQL